MTTDVPSGLSSSSIDAKPSARARASIVLRLGSDVPERMSATVPRPRPDASANARIVFRPRRSISTRVRAATSTRASVRAEFRTARAGPCAVSAIPASVSAYTCGIQLSGIPRAVSHPYRTLKSERVFGSGAPGRSAMTTVAAVPAPREALLGPNSQRLEVGLLGARTAAVLRRIIDGLVMEDVDRTVLQTATAMMDAAADAVEVVQAGGQLRRDRRSLGFGAMAFTVELAAPASMAPSDLPDFLRGITHKLNELQSAPDPKLAEEVLPAFSMLADVATRQAGTAGEGGGSLI
jgi:hypothetical protein